MWAQGFNTALGLWLMLSPSMLGYSGMSAMNHYTVGPLVGTIAFLAMWEVLRGLRWLNIALGIWLMISALIFEHPTVALVTALVVGLAITGLAPLSRPPSREYGGGWRMLWSQD
jgi:hypothetical protein